MRHFEPDARYLCWSSENWRQADLVEAERRLMRAGNILSLVSFKIWEL
jgi:hypothetical protein